MTRHALKKPYAASVFCTRLGSYSSILVAYQSVLLQSLSLDHRPSPLQLDELSLVSNHLIPLSKYNGQALGRSMAALVVARRQLWLAQARQPDKDNASLLDAPVTPGHTFGPAVDEMLKNSQQALESGHPGWPWTVVYFPTIATAFIVRGEDQARSSPGALSSPKVAQENMVLITGPAPVRSAVRAASPSRPAEPGAGAEWHPDPTVLQFWVWPLNGDI
ncbi:UNVERIFIED_CONTAM: hypothetical protein FKN15_074733 [Acipenser sinensis]